MAGEIALAMGSFLRIQVSGVSGWKYPKWTSGYSGSDSTMQRASAVAREKKITEIAVVLIKWSIVRLQCAMAGVDICQLHFHLQRLLAHAMRNEHRRRVAFLIRARLQRSHKLIHFENAVGNAVLLASCALSSVRGVACAVSTVVITAKSQPMDVICHLPNGYAIYYYIWSQDHAHSHNFYQNGMLLHLWRRNDENGTRHMNSVDD